MTERNLCLELGCRGFCCFNTKVEEREAIFLDCFPNAVEITVSDVPKLGCIPDGVYYMYDGESMFSDGGVVGFIKGKCPHLSQNGTCGNYDGRTNACKNFIIGGERCNKMRVKVGLEAILKVPQDVDILVFNVI